MKSSEFVKKAIDIATKYKTLYVMGCFGAPMNAKNKQRYTNNHSYNKKSSRKKMILNASSDTFGFDCVCLIKGILWGWDGNVNRVYGGATYKLNDIPDFSTESMKQYCTSWSNDFSNIEIGEALYLKGHSGIYIGNGLAVECTPNWQNKVQITAVSNIGKKAGYNSRKWIAHGKLKFIEYEKQPQPINEWSDGDYRVLIPKTLRKSMSLIPSNRVRVKEVDAGTKKILTSTRPNDIAMFKVGAEIKLSKSCIKGGLRWMQYGNVYIVVQNKDGSKQVERI